MNDMNVSMSVTSIQRGDGTYARLLPDVSIIDHLSAGSTYIEIDEPNGYLSLKNGEWLVYRQRGKDKNVFSVMGRFDNLREALTCAINAQTPKHESEWEA